MWISPPSKHATLIIGVIILFIISTTSMTLDGSKAREMENELLGEYSGDVVEAFRAITSLVTE